jgi:outer membrane protein
MKRFLYLLVVAFISLSGIQAQKTWTLEECIKYALDKNIQIKRQQLTHEIDEQNFNQSKYNMLPNLGAGFTHNLNSGKALNTDKYVWENKNFQEGSMGVQANVTLFNGFQMQNSIKFFKLSMQKSLADLEKAKNDISLNVALGYLDILYNTELLEVAKSQIEVTLLQVERNKKLVEVGNVARGTLLEIQSQAAREKVNVTNAKNALDISYLNLSQLLELDSVGNFQITKPELLSVEENKILESVMQIYTVAVSRMPQVKSSELNLEVQKANLAIAKGKYSPSLTMSGLYYSRYSALATDPLNPSSKYTYMNQLKDNQYKQLSLSLNIPIFSKFQTRTTVSNSKIQVSDAEITLVQIKKTLYKEIQQAHADALASFDNYTSRKEAVLSSEEAFKYSQQKFDVGMISAVDYNLAKNNLTKAKSDLIQAKYQFIFKVKVLDFYKGSALTL